MNNLNSILIEGNLVKDPDYRLTPKGTPVCTFNLAVNRFYPKDEGIEKEVSFFEVESWSKLAEHCAIKERKVEVFELSAASNSSVGTIRKETRSQKLWLWQSMLSSKRNSRRRISDERRKS